MALNERALNTYAINEEPSAIVGSGAGILVSIEQNIVNYGSGTIASIEQEVVFRSSTSTLEYLINFEQVVLNQYSGTILPIEQTILNASETNTFYDKNGWDAKLVIGGNEVSRSYIAGRIDVSRTEGDAALMDFTLRPAAGVQTFENYQGKTVTLDITSSSGISRVYTGVIDIITVDVVNESVRFSCTDRRTEKLNSQDPIIKNSIGIYSSTIFPKAEDTAQEIEQRLTTVPYVVDFDAYGNLNITSIAPKSTADFTFTASDIYRDKPEVELTSRARIINKVNINFEYRYQRYYNMARTFIWNSPLTDNICLFLNDGHTLTSRELIIGAVNNTSWKRTNDINFTDVWDAGYYWCDGMQVGWSPGQLNWNIYAKKDEQGNVVTDDKDNIVYTGEATGGVDYSSMYCLGADWRMAYRWTQTITETYTMSVSAPQSISQFGTVSSNLYFSQEDEINTDLWEGASSYSGTVNSTYSVDQKINQTEANLAISTALNIAKTTILKSHRDNRVMVDMFINPSIDLRHTVQLSTSTLSCKGKVYNIKHTIDISSREARTEITLALSRAQGSTSESALAIPTAPTDNIEYPTGLVVLGSHYGEDPTTEAAKSWNGFIGNKWVTVANDTHKTDYTVQFIVDTPAVPDALRTAKDLTTSQSYNVSIPNDTLTITFDGKI